MTLTIIFLAFALAAGTAVGAALVEFPALRALNLPPYFIALIALAAFDAITYLRASGAPGTMVTMPVRFLGFVVSITAIAAIAWWAGIEVRYF